MTAVAGSQPIFLDQPPQVIRVGIGRHGTTGLVDRFSLPELWSLHLYSYRATLLVEGHSFEIKPNVVSLVPPGSRIEYRYLGPSQHLYAHLQITAHGRPRQLPLVQAAGADAPLLTALFRSSIEAFAATPERAQADLWSILWRFAATAEDGIGSSRSPYVAAGISYLQATLARPVTVPEVAEQVGLSHNHLTRLFQAELGCTVVEYLRTARLTLAAHLLRDSTMPIAGIASTVGIPDLQAFNKACRRVLGASPRDVRASQAGHLQRRPT